jgi:hypothetical protein
MKRPAQPNLDGGRDSVQFGVRHRIELKRGKAPPREPGWTDEDDAMWVHLHLSALRHGANGCRAWGYDDRLDGGARAGSEGGD